MAQQNWKLVLKFVVAVSLMVGLGTCLFTCFEFYLEFPTYTDISMVNQNESLFAAVTLCPEPDSKSKAKLDVLKANGIDSDLVYHGFKPPKEWIPNSTISPQQLFQMVTYDLEEIIERVMVRYINRVNGSYTHKFFPPLEGLRVIEQRKRSHLKCWTISLPKEMTNTPIYYIQYTIAMSVKYYMHKEGQFLNGNGRMPFRFKRGTRQEAQVSTWDMQLLNNQYVKNDCEPDEKPFDDCLYKALEHHMVKNTKANCTVPWTRDNSRICSDPDDIQKAFNESWKRGTNQEKDCKKPCHSLEVAIIGSNVLEKNDSKLMLFFKPVVTKSEEKRLYEWRNLFAEIGGYVGVFLGYSLYSLVDGFEWVLKIALGQWIIRTKTNSHIKKTMY